MKLPPCGIYRTTSPIEGIPAGRLVYFHNHGNPGPGVYLPETWTQNEAIFRAQGTTLPAGFSNSDLMPLPAEGLYFVARPFVCCDQECSSFEKDAILQLGYNREGAAIVFQPAWGSDGLQVPERGTRIDDDRLAALRPLKYRKTGAVPTASVH